MNKFFLTGLLISITSFLFAQNADGYLNEKEALRIENVLASDEMRGRRAFTPEADKAADYIAEQFKAAHLKTMNENTGFRQEFSIVTAKLQHASYTINREEANEKNVVVITCQSRLYVTEKSGYERIMIKKGQSLFNEADKLISSGKNCFVWVDTSFTKNFKRLNGFKEGLFKSDKNVVFVLSASEPAEFTIEALHEIEERKLANVAGILPGKGRKNEYVIFSAHYDHLGTGSPEEGYPHDSKDSIYNGANDDASGVTAVIMLAKYFVALKNNERTIIFVAFTGEEVGGYGSRYFSKQLDPASIIAMFNIEMIGTESRWGKNSAYITGYEKTDMGKILQKDLEGTGFTFYPDPYPQQNLFYRSDNATLALLGVPAHTISTSKMDNEPNYHRVSDEVKTLDMENMAMIIKSVALSSKSIISGKETPARVKEDK